MNRLHVFDVVEVSATSTLKARVVALDGRQAALLPVNPVDVLALPAETHDVLLLFRRGTQRIVLKGSLYYRGGFEELGFLLTDEFCAPATASTRAALCAPVWLTPIDDGTQAQGTAIAHQTTEVAADGLTLEPGCPVAPGAHVRVTLVMPEDAEPVEALAYVVRGDGDELRLRFTTISREHRAKVHRHVVAVKRQELKRAFAPREVGYVW